MKENLKTILQLLGLLIVFSFCGYLLYTKILDGEVVAILFAAIATTYYSYLKQKIEDDKMFKELFVSFNEKYNGKTNDIFNELRNGSSAEGKVELSQKRVNIIIDYFNLCAEEYLWYSKGRVPKQVWKAWRCGMIENISIPQVKEIYKKEVESSGESYYGLVEELKIKF